jgi:hypothetical protein
VACDWLSLTGGRPQWVSSKWAQADTTMLVFSRKGIQRKEQPLGRELTRISANQVLDFRIANF